MDKEQVIALAIRGLKDVEAQAEQIALGDDSPVKIESFAKFSNEMKGFILKYVRDKEIHAYTQNIPDIDYSRVEMSIWNFLSSNYYRDARVLREAISAVAEVRRRYEHLGTMIRKLGDRLSEVEAWKVEKVNETI